MTKVNAIEVAPQNNRTYINVVLDETGSMDSCRDSTISSFNEYINSQKGLEGECFVSLTTFDQGWRDARPSVRDVYRNVPISGVPALTRDTFVPNGGTNLYDAIGSTIKNLEASIKDEKANVLVVIITDGGENSSKEYNLSQIKTMVGEKEKEGWTFVYLGANQDAWQVGASFGLSKGQTMTYDVANMSGTMTTLAAATTAYRSSRMDICASASVEKNFFGDKDAK